MTEIDNLIAEIVPRYRDRDKKPAPASEHILIYDSTSETLEPVYFWILDFMNNMFGGKVEKLIDNFASSPGSGHFSELQGKASQMQQEASRVLGTVNNILKGVINLIYDIKEFKIRLSHYDAANSKEKEKAESGSLALKQLWMDKVDMQRGQGSINAMSSGNLQFVTLRDAFMIVNSIEEVDKLDLNERVKRVLKPRVQEFLEWKKRSEQELRKRYEIEKIYLKSQLDALKLNARWAKPYLRAAEQLRSNDGLLKNPALVTAFNTVLLELSILGRSAIKVQEESINKRLPMEFSKMKNLRKYNSVVLIDFNFRGIPSKSGQHYTFGGRAEVYFRCYALSDDELLLLNDKLSDNDLNSALKLVEGMTEESLAQIQVDLDEILGEGKKEPVEEDSNPFSALLSFFIPEKKEDKKSADEKKLEKLKKEFKQRKKLKDDNFPEKYIRNFAEADAMNSCFTVYDKYKKAHGMVTFPYGGDENEGKVPQFPIEEFLGFSPVSRYEPD